MVSSFSLQAPRTIGATTRPAPATLRGVGGDRDGLAIARDKILGARDHFDHALVGFARVLAEGDDAVLAQG